MEYRFCRARCRSNDRDSVEIPRNYERSALTVPAASQTAGTASAVPARLAQNEKA